MADSKDDKNVAKASAPKSETTKAADAQAEATTAETAPTREGDRYGAPGLTGGSPGGDDGDNLAEAQQRSYEVRTTVPNQGTVQGTLDARLDNRTGTDRPPLLTYPAVPQQVDGPDVVNQADFTRRYLDSINVEDTGPRLGMHSVGPHGISADESIRSGNDNANESGGEAAPDGETGATGETLRAAATKGVSRVV